MRKYVQKEIGFYEVSELLSENFEVGDTIDDFKAGKFLLLGNSQISFHEENPNATPEEVLNMALTPMVMPTLIQVKQQKIAEILAYDQSPEVNSFTINGVSMWLDRNTRASLFITIAAYRANGLTQITLWTTGSNPVPITLLVDDLEQLLIGLEMYAKATYDITAQHK